MKSILWVVLGYTWGTILAATPVNAENLNHSIKFKGIFSGTTLASVIDLNDDGDKAEVITYAGRTTLGPVTVQGLSDDIVFPPNDECFQGGLDLYERRDVFRLVTGELLYAEYTDQRICISFAPSFSVTAKGKFIGGTGRYTNASGTFEAKAEGQFLLSDSRNNGLTAFTAKINGELKIPNLDAENSDDIDDHDDD